MLSPQRIDSLREKLVHNVEFGRPLPWEQGHPIRRESLLPSQAWQHIVYCGVFENERFQNALLSIFGREEGEEYEPKPTGESALLVFVVNDEGFLLETSVVLSAAAWGLGKAKKPGPDDPRWLDGFNDEAKKCAQTLLDLGNGKAIVRGREAKDGLGLLKKAGTIVLDAAVAGGVAYVGQTYGPVVGAFAGSLASQAKEVREAAATAGERRHGEDPEATDDESVSDAADPSDTRLPARIGNRAITVRDIAAFTKWVADRFDVVDDLEPNTARTKSVVVAKKKADETKDVIQNGLVV